MLIEYSFQVFAFALLFLITSTFIKINRPKNSQYFNIFLKLVLVITLYVSFFALTITFGRTIFIIAILALIFTLKQKLISFTIPNFKKGISENLLPLILVFPVLLVQFILNYDFYYKNPYVVSDDIYLYATIGNQMLSYGQENTSAFLSYFYKNDFSGIQPYHYFEIWLNAFVSFINQKSHVYNLIFISYTLLLWILLLGYLALCEKFKIHKKIYIIIMPILLFIGPIYLNTYSTLFNDGNLFNSAVFTITGFVKQTLPLSFYGQKHLPIYIFSILLINSYLISNTRLIFFSITMLCVASIGVFPGMVFLSFYILVTNKKIRQLYTFKSISVLILFVVILKIFEIGVAHEINYKTSYVTYFLKYLNWKGEILFMLEKLFFPLFWFSVLYFPFIIVFYKLKKVKPSSFFIYLLIIYLGGTLFTLTIYGINSDQFLTNLLPIFNVCVVFFTLKSFKIYFLENSKKQLIIIGLFSIIFTINNVYWLFNFHFIDEFKMQHIDKYSNQSQRKLLNELKNNNTTFAYLLNDSLNQNVHPAQYHPFFPAKFIMDKNYFNFVNINYPFIKFKSSSVSNAYSPRNQMKYYIEKNKLQNMKFDSIQLCFLKSYRINWVLCTEKTKFPKLLERYTNLKIYDSKSKETYYRLKFQ